MTRTLFVLYVDDEPDLLEIGRLFLEQSGEYMIDTSVSAADALIRLKQKKYDAIISDYQMPEMDGIKFLQVLRNRGDMIPFIIFTGRGREEVIIEALNSGVDYYLQKGGDPKAQFAELKNIVGKAVRQKGADEELKESEAKYRNILENIQDVYYRTDGNGNLILASPSIAIVLEYDSLSELYGTNIADTLYHNPEQRKEVLAEINRSGSITNYEVTLKKRDGTPVFVLTSSHRDYDQSGNFLGVEGIFRDITGLKHTEELLRESEALYRAVFDNTGAATIIIASDTTIMLANDGWEKLTGVKKEEQEHKTSWTIFIDKRDVERMKQYHYTRRKDPSIVPRIYECRLIDAAGNIHNCIVNVLMIPGSSNSVASLVDITELKLAEEALQRINKKLNLMSSITRHDILNQLSALSGFTELLKTHLTKPQDLEYIGQSETAIHNIEQQITFTKAYQDIGVNGPEWQKTADIIRQAASQLSLGTIKLDINLDNIEIYADPLLVKVFNNLIDNSLRYGDKITEIRFYSAKGHRGFVLFCEDDGVGISANEKDRIFDRGFGRHTGFGLFLAREILSITGLTITETGEPGKGARFEIHIPKGTSRPIHP